MSNQEYENLEYVVVGAGPAAICAVAKLYSTGVPGNRILWVNPEFKVGDFGTILSDGSSVPGNTNVESYQRVNRGIYDLVPVCEPTKEEILEFEITHLAPEVTCTLKVAAEPLQHITHKLRELVCSIQGLVLTLKTTKAGIVLEIMAEAEPKHVTSKRVLLAVGATPKSLPLEAVTILDSNVAFIASKTREYLRLSPDIHTVAVIGSSHSAALATMHFLQEGIRVKQFMNKPYKFATPSIAPDGRHYTMFDNTGLKGEVATFTRTLLAGGEFSEKWEQHMNQQGDALLKEHLPECSHAIVCVGYSPRFSLTVNNLDLSAFRHDVKTSQLLYADGRPVDGVFGIGVGFPKQVTAISGEVEFAVGVGKFWASFGEDMLQYWQEHPAIMGIPLKIPPNLA